MFKIRLPKIKHLKYFIFCYTYRLQQKVRIDKKHIKVSKMSHIFFFQNHKYLQSQEVHHSFSQGIYFVTGQFFLHSFPGILLLVSDYKCLQRVSPQAVNNAFIFFLSFSSLQFISDDWSSNRRVRIYNIHLLSSLKRVLLEKHIQMTENVVFKA